MRFLIICSLFFAATVLAEEFRPEHDHEVSEVEKKQPKRNALLNKRSYSPGQYGSFPYYGNQAPQGQRYSYNPMSVRYLMDQQYTNSGHDFKSGYDNQQYPNNQYIPSNYYPQNNQGYNSGHHQTYPNYYDGGQSMQGYNPMQGYNQMQGYNPMQGGYNPMQGYNPMLGYIRMQGYNPMQDYNQMQGYNLKQGGYNPMQDYNQMQGYNLKQGGYNPMQDYNQMQGYNPMQGYNQMQGYNPMQGGYYRTQGSKSYDSYDKFASPSAHGGQFQYNNEGISTRLFNPGNNNIGNGYTDRGYSHSSGLPTVNSDDSWMK